MNKKVVYLLILALFIIIILTSVLWNSEVSTEISGVVSLKGELFCPCFLVNNVEVWYDLMEGKPAVDVSEINNGDFVLVKGEFQENELFWATEISKKNICKSEDREVDACIIVYDPVCGYDSSGNKVNTFSNSCFACLDTTIIYYINGECPWVKKTKE